MGSKVIMGERSGCMSGRRRRRRGEEAGVVGMRERGGKRDTDSHRTREAMKPNVRSVNNECNRSSSQSHVTRVVSTR